MVDKKVQDHLAKQDASTVDATKLTALTPEVVSVVCYIVLFYLLFLFVYRGVFLYRGTARVELRKCYLQRKFCA